jgi:nucleoid DNA-binding protein
MTNKEFVKHIMAMYPGMLRDDVQKIVHIVFNGMRSALSTGDSLNIPGLGTMSPEFINKTQKIKSGLTGEEHEVGPRVRLRFRSSKKFEQHLTERLMPGGGNGVNYHVEEIEGETEV